VEERFVYEGYEYVHSGRRFKAEEVTWVEGFYPGTTARSYDVRMFRDSEITWGPKEEDLKVLTPYQVYLRDKTRSRRTVFTEETAFSVEGQEYVRGVNALIPVRRIQKASLFLPNHDLAVYSAERCDLDNLSYQELERKGYKIDG
jgi:hypothetical protein